MKRRIFGIFLFIIMFFGFFFGITFSSGFNLGDGILKSIGLNVWSNDTSGLHYTAVYSLVIIILAWIGVDLTLGRIYPKVINIISLLLTLIFIIPIILISLM